MIHRDRIGRDIELDNGRRHRASTAWPVSVVPVAARFGYPLGLDIAGVATIGQVS